MFVFEGNFSADIYRGKIMTMFLLTVTGILSVVAMFRAVITNNNLLGVFGVISFLLTIILTNGVAP